MQTGIVFFVLFTSPESLVLPIWMTFVDKLIKIEMLTLICIDEVHLLIEFGLSFRIDFLLLCDTIFNKIQRGTTPMNELSNNNTGNGTILKLPLHCITATCNTQLLYLIQSTTNIRFSHRHLHWSNKTEF